MSNIKQTRISLRKGLKSDLPSHAPLGEPLYCIDTQELYMGNGSNGELMLIANIQEILEARGSNTTLNQRLSNMDNKLKYVTYEMFGALGDGEHDDGEAIKMTHEYANKHNLSVRCPSPSKYCIKSTTEIEIKTDTDWGGSSFYIDDSIGEDKEIFLVPPSKKSFSLDSTIVNKLQNSKIQPKVGKINELANNGDALVIVYDSTTKHYKRSLIEDGGSPKCDHFIIDNDGFVQNDIIWDFPTVTSVAIIPLDTNPLIIKNGNFYTTQGVQGENYSFRGMYITRSNTTLQNVHHYITNNESNEHFAPSMGFIKVTKCCNVYIKDCTITPRYYRRNNSGIALGTYDLTLQYTIDITLENCNGQSFNNNLWGVMGTDYIKNTLIKNCKLNRVDSHKQAHNIHIQDSEIGTRGITLIGSGLLKIDNVTSFASTFLDIRADYGCCWKGNMEISNIVHKPYNFESASFIKVAPDLDHDYGYECYLSTDYIKVTNYYIDKIPNRESFYFIDILPSRHTGNRRYNLPSRIELSQIHCGTNEKGLDTLKILDISLVKVKNNGLYFKHINDGSDKYSSYLDIIPNFKLIVDNFDFHKRDISGTPYSTSILFHSKDISENDSIYTDLKSLIPEIFIYNCQWVCCGLHGRRGILNIENSEIVSSVNIDGGCSSITHFTNCTFRPRISKASDVSFRVGRRSSSFLNCTFSCPIKDDVALVEGFDSYEFFSLTYPKLDGAYSNCLLDPRIKFTYDISTSNILSMLKSKSIYETAMRIETNNIHDSSIKTLPGAIAFSSKDNKVAFKTKDGWVDSEMNPIVP